MADSPNWRIRAPSVSNTKFRSNNYPSWRSREHKLKQQTDSPDDHQAIIEGRRLYLGNLLYSTTVEDIGAFLDDNGFSSFKSIHISIDPFSGRNASYCFVTFADRATADAALSKLEGALIHDRPVKCRPCQRKGVQRQVSWHESGSSFNGSRWDYWTRECGDGGHHSCMVPRNSDSGQLSKGQEEGRQLYVGGLPRMLDQIQIENETEMRAIFKDFEVEAVSKRVSPRMGPQGGVRRNFCFIDFSTREQAHEAMQAVQGTMYRGAPLRIRKAIPRDERYWMRMKGEGTDSSL